MVSQENRTLPENIKMRKTIYSQPIKAFSLIIALSFLNASNATASMLTCATGGGSIETCSTQIVSDQDGLLASIYYVQDATKTLGPVVENGLTSLETQTQNMVASVDNLSGKVEDFGNKVDKIFSAQRFFKVSFAASIGAYAGSAFAKFTFSAIEKVAGAIHEAFTHEDYRNQLRQTFFVAKDQWGQLDSSVQGIASYADLIDYTADFSNAAPGFTSIAQHNFIESSTNKEAASNFVSFFNSAEPKMEKNLEKICSQRSPFRNAKIYFKTAISAIQRANFAIQKSYPEFMTFLNEQNLEAIKSSAQTDEEFKGYVNGDRDAPQTMYGWFSTESRTQDEIIIEQFRETLKNYQNDYSNAVQKCVEKVVAEMKQSGSQTSSPKPVDSFPNPFTWDSGPQASTNSSHQQSPKETCLNQKAIAQQKVFKSLNYENSDNGLAPTRNEIEWDNKFDFLEDNLNFNNPKVVKALRDMKSRLKSSQEMRESFNNDQLLPSQGINPSILMGEEDAYNQWFQDVVNTQNCMQYIDSDWSQNFDLQNNPACQSNLTAYSIAKAVSAFSKMEALCGK